LNFLLAPKAIGQQFEIISDSLGKQIQILSRKTVLLKQSRDLLLSRLMSGRLAVNELDIAMPPSMR